MDDSLVFWAYALAAHAVAAFIMVHIPPKHTAERVTAVIVIASLCVRAIAAVDRTTDAGQNHAEYMFGFILHANCFLVLLQLAAPRVGKTTGDRWNWACAMLFNPRLMIRKPPRPKTRRPEDRWIFMGLRLLQLFFLNSAFEYFRDQELLPFEIQPFDLGPSKDSKILQLYHATLTRRDLLIRAEMAFLSLVMPALVLSTAHALFSIFGVLIFEDDPADWPPLFGNILHAWSVRRWYSHFWEQLMRKAFTINAAAFAQRVLRIRPGSVLGRACITLLAFTMSGFMHTVAGWNPGPCASSMPMWTYMATGVVILMERAVQAVYARVLHSRKGLRWRWKMWEIWGWRLLGYCWVVFWWLEVLPWGVRPGMRCAWGYA